MTTKSFFNNWIVKNVLLAVLCVLCLVLIISILLAFGTQHNREITVPDFTNMTFEEAHKVASSAGVKVVVMDSLYVRRLKPGTVYLQTPEAGSKVKSGRIIRLTTNTVIPKEVNMPSLVGSTLRQAKAELSRNGLVLGKLMYVDDIATNNVLRQERGGVNIAPGAQVASGTTINLVLGLNASDNLTYVPKLIGKQYLSAVDLLLDNSLNIGNLHFDNTVHEYADSVSAVVYFQSPSGSEKVPMGSEVRLSLTTDMSKLPHNAGKE